MSIKSSEEKQFIVVNFTGMKIPRTGNRAMLANAFHFPGEEVDFIKIVQSIDFIETPKYVDVVVHGAEGVARPLRRDVSGEIQFIP